MAVALPLVTLLLCMLMPAEAQCNGRHVISADGGVSGTFASNPEGTSYLDNQNCEWLLVGSCCVSACVITHCGVMC